MIVREILKEYKGKDIKLGANSFVFCDVVSDDIENIINDISNNYYQNMLKNKSWLEEYLDPTNFERRWTNNYKMVCKQYKDIRTKKEIKEHWLKKKNHAFVYYSKRLKGLNKRIEKFTPFLERKVIDVYQSILDKNVTIIRFSGVDQGQFWDKEEYHKYLEDKQKEAEQKEEATQNEENVVNC